MAVMLDRLAVRPGMRVLEVGTGYNAALLCARLGDQQVTTIDIDPALTADER
jgi:protein-L-isoaspartate O-methyltransferase